MLEYSQIISKISLLVDGGLVVLIWVVQLVIYPSFMYYHSKKLIEWHKIYTNRIAIIVIPLMLLQLIIAITTIFLNFNLQTLTVLIIVFFLWMYTFLGFAPLHFKISKGKHNLKLIQILIQRNWLRTFLWTVLLVLNHFI